MADSPRIEELRRRVHSDPASIAFAALAEEYRRTGRYEEAIDVCRVGLQRHPSYISAHVTLGRALIETGAFDEARHELEYVLGVAPENLAAIRGLAEIHSRRPRQTETTDFSDSAVAAMAQAVAPFEEAASRPPAGVIPLQAPAPPAIESLLQPAVEEAQADAAPAEAAPAEHAPVPEPQPVASDSEPAAVDSDRIAIDSEPVAIEPEPAAIEPTIELVEPEPAPIELDAKAHVLGLPSIEHAIDLSAIDLTTVFEPTPPAPEVATPIQLVVPEPAAAVRVTEPDFTLERLETFLQAIIRARDAAGGRRAS
jgi:tetratricopeptide (TPR) repeat protein